MKSCFVCKEIKNNKIRCEICNNLVCKECLEITDKFNTRGICINCYSKEIKRFEDWKNVRN